METSKQWLMAIVVVLVANVIIWSTFAYLTLQEHEEKPIPIVLRIDDSSLQTSKLVDHGSGTPSDPYVITGLEIEVKRYAGNVHGIYISDLDACLVISGSRIRTDYSGSYYETFGISVWHSPHVDILGCEFENLTRAIDVIDSAVKVSYNIFKSCGAGIVMERPQHYLAPGMQILQNSFWETNYGVQVMGNSGGFTWSDVLIRNNSMSDYECGVGVYGRGYGITIVGNTFHDGSEYAIKAFELSASEIVDNVMSYYYGNGGGIGLHRSTHVQIENNSIITNGPAISIESSTNLTISNNSMGEFFHDDGAIHFGIYTSNSISVNVTYNKIVGWTFGIMILSTAPGNSMVWVHHNEFMSNFIPATDNSVLENYWDDGIGAGNYWDDYEGTDSDGDGVGDTPYQIDSNNADHYPLMALPV